MTLDFDDVLRLKLEPQEAGFALQHLDVRKTALRSICLPRTACNHTNYR